MHEIYLTQNQIKKRELFLLKNLEILHKRRRDLWKTT